MYTQTQTHTHIHTHMYTHTHTLTSCYALLVLQSQICLAGTPSEAEMLTQTMAFPSVDKQKYQNGT